MSASAPGYLLNAESSYPSKSIVVLGASGSVGSTTLSFLRSHNGSQEEKIILSGVSVHSSIDELRRILNEFSPQAAAISDSSVFDERADSLRADFPSCRFFRGEDGLVEMIGFCRSSGADTVLTAVVGASGIRATVESLNLNFKVALANKETMVTAGPAIENLLLAKRNEAPGDRPVIMPVDSEHNAVFQTLFAVKPEHISRVILTASGGPFRDRSLETILKATRKEVLNHPTWNMGPKITVDSAGMINKGLEVIEARFLFSIEYDMLDVLIHRNSLVHGMVELKDGGYLMCASTPNMVFPIAHSLFYPDAVPARHKEAETPDAWKPIDFEPVSRHRFPGYALCLQAARAGGTGPAIFNAANEIAVEFFLEDKIKFSEIPRLIDSVLQDMPVEQGSELGLFLEADFRARSLARSALKTIRGV